MPHKHKHVVVGGGFGGLRIARMLANRDDIDVVVVNPQANFEYHGSLYRSANGYSPLETVVPYREIFADTNIEFRQDFMVDVDPAAKRIKLLSGHEMTYDSVTLALGYEPEYFGIPGMREFSKTLYSLADALELRKTLTSVARNSFHKSSPSKVIVAGAGPTGVEVAASISHFFELVTGDGRVDVKLLEGQSRILSGLPEDFSDVVDRTLDCTVQVLCNKKVIRASKQLVHIADGNPLQFDVLIWTAGSSANGYFRQRQDLFEIDGKGRVLLNQHLLTKHDSLYVIGDSAAVQYSGTAHAALEMGSYVANHVVAKLYDQHIDTYQPSQPPYAVPTAHDAAVAMKDGVLIEGADGWQIRRELDLSALMLIAPAAVARTHWEKGEKLASFVAAR